ncbi:DNA mismatch repair protein MutS [Peptoniphilaceae bacterium SGI.131]
MINIDVSKLTPMMQQYMKIKNENSDSIVFYRLGDFYEMFFDDAKTASKELELALTGRDCGLEEKAPMCGVPHHVAEVYLNRLVDKGYKVALVDQVEDPKLTKGIVKRSVTRIITPGTLIDLEGKERDNNFLLCIYQANHSYGISYIDITTGELNTSEINNAKFSDRDLLDFVVKVNPKEVITNRQIAYKPLKDYIDTKNIFLSIIDKDEEDLSLYLDKIKNYTNKIKLGQIKKHYLSIISTSNLLDYIYLYREDKLDHITDIKYIQAKSFMRIDASTRDSLEIHKNLYEASKKYSLLNIIDRASTPMGSRKINSWLEFPLINIDDINSRLDSVAYLFANISLVNELKNYLDQIYDLERILGKIAFYRANARDLLNLKRSIEFLPQIKGLLLKQDNQNMKEIGSNLDELSDLYKLIDDSIREDSPLQITEGGLIKEGFSPKLDEIKNSSTIGNRLLLEYEAEERENSGIKNLKVSYNKNTGYYIELTKSNIGQAPAHYIRRQTLKNAERYITPRLNEISDMILGGQEQTIELEYQLFVEIRTKISENAQRIKQTADNIASLDALNSFAQVSKNNNYVRPVFNKENYFDIKNGRHPIVEKSIGQHSFIANDTQIGKDNKIIQIITGPNMAGKSTYMRQVALIVIMAQIGSFVPADYCDICISDALFSRIGASDNLAKGDSTFMVEMKEMSNIIANASKNSFVILDEVGRGTGTNDGYSIAKAICEYISKKLKVKTLFATHYHELTHMADERDNIENLKVDIAENKGNLIFLRKIMKGKADKSYGIEVAKLSGLPDEIINRAAFILNNMDTSPILKEKEIKSTNQKSIYDLDRELFIKEISNLDIDSLSAREALDKLYDYKERAEDLSDD